MTDWQSKDPFLPAVIEICSHFYFNFEDTKKAGKLQNINMYQLAHFKISLFYKTDFKTEETFL